ncbi:leucine-rich repeat protein [Perkinsela sp. CCAP 1560/4]|nr:leucine-rich repeat protein [Perkinsela sp. CCAP 1560/4]|eukprot:KNH04143.1 leucine-rich repeat protein [Perkinsela sp. CCAP 1560/4]
MQDTLVQLVLPDGLAQLFADGEPNLPVCQWRGFCREPFLLHAKCFNGILRELVVANDGSRIDRIAYYYAPPTLEQLEVYGFDVIGRFAPRLLPRSAIYVIIARARLTGTVEFRELPRNLQELNLFGNNLTGPLFLCMLPGNIRMLNFVSNEIHQDHLFYGDLPVALESVFIDRGSGTLKSLEKGELSKQREAIFHRL